MPNRTIKLVAAALTAGLLGACANDGSMIGSSLTTSSVDATQQAKAAAPKVDPACIQLAAQIDGLRKEGVVERAEKASAGKTANVQVKRASLAKLAELDKANADFQAKCSNTPAPATAVAPAAPAAPASAASATTATPAAAPAKTSEAPAKTTKKVAEAKATETVTKAKATATNAATAAAPPAPVVATPAPAAPAPVAAATPAPAAKPATTATIPSVPSVPGISIAQ